MADAVLRYGDKELTLPTVAGTVSEVGMEISGIRSRLGLITIDRGFSNTAEGTSRVSYVGGEEGVLSYRGYPIEQLADQASFLEVVYLLQYGELPTKDQLDEYEESITRHTLLREDVKHLFEAFPHSAHPMQILASATSALATYYPDALDPLDEDSVDISARRLIAKTPTMIAWSFKYRMHQPYVYPDNELDYASNFLKMMFSVPAEEFQPDPVIAKALNMLLILHADHGQNCSSSAVRLVGSGQANIFSSVSAGIHALSGPLHGGANEAVLAMLEMIVADGGDVASWVNRAKDKDDPFRLMGFGHRVQELRPEGQDHQAGHRRSARSIRRRRLVARRRPPIGGSRSVRRLLHQPEALSERRLLLGHPLPGHGLSDRHVHRPLRPGTSSRMDLAMARADGRP